MSATSVLVSFIGGFAIVVISMAVLGATAWHVLAIMIPSFILGLIVAYLQQANP
jgi:hypothetical protein